MFYLTSAITICRRTVPNAFAADLTYERQSSVTTSCLGQKLDLTLFYVSHHGSMRAQNSEISS